MFVRKYVKIDRVVTSIVFTFLIEWNAYVPVRLMFEISSVFCATLLIKQWVARAV